MKEIAQERHTLRSFLRPPEQTLLAIPMVVVAVWYGIGIILVAAIGTLNVAKKSKTAKRGGPARRKKGMKAKKKPAPKAAPVPITPSPPVWEGFGGMKKATPAKKKKKKRAPKPAPAPPSPLLKILGEDR